jgi:hypothetical protein
MQALKHPPLRLPLLLRLWLLLPGLPLHNLPPETSPR